MVKRLILFCLLVCCLGCSQHYFTWEESPKLTSISLISRDGVSETISTKERLQQYENVDFLSSQPYQKILRIYARDSNGNLKAYINSYHPNGSPKQYLEVVNNRAFGVYKEWHERGALKIEGRLVGGDADITSAAQQSWLFDGCCRIWDDYEHLSAEIPYIKGELEGKAIYYHPNGAIWKVVTCCKGVMDGLEEIFLVDGTVLQTTNYCQGAKHGPACRYWDNGQLAFKEEYVSGNLHAGQYYEPDGKMICEVKEGTGMRAVFGKESLTELQEYKKGFQEGTVQYFDHKGSLLSTVQMINGEKQGEEIQYYPLEETKNQLQPRLSISWMDDRMHGIVKTWYPSGNQESQREMSSNQKNGLLTAWYKEGSVMLVEEYDRDKLKEGQYFIRGEKIPITEVHAGRGMATLFDGDGNFLRKVQYNNGKPID